MSVPKKDKMLVKTELWKQKFSSLVRFWIKLFTTRQILIEPFTTRQILKKNLFLKGTILRKKLFLRNRFWKKFCTKKITFWFNWPRKMRKFCILSAILEITIFKKNCFQKARFWLWFFPKSMVLNIWMKSFSQKAWFWTKKISLLSDFESKFFRLVSFWINSLTTR